MAEKTVKEFIQSIQESLEKIEHRVKDLPEETIRWKPSEEEWSILQILSHVLEATPYWLNEMERIIETPGVEWGRGLQDEARLAAVANPDALSVEETIKGVANLKDLVAEKLGKVTDEQLKIESPHRNFKKFGKKPVSFLVGHFLDEHIAGHYNQIERNLSKWEEK